MAKVSRQSKNLMIVGTLIAVAALCNLWVGNYGVGGFMVAIAAFEFFLARSTIKRAAGG